MFKKIILAFLFILLVGYAVFFMLNHKTEVVVDIKTFTPVYFAWPASHEGVSNILVTDKPYFIKNEPIYYGNRQVYGCMNLGNYEYNQYCFAIDIATPENTVMYFDFNQNYNLTDDGGPLINQGAFKKNSLGFAATLSIPWQQVMAYSPFEGAFDIWFYANEDAGALRTFSHYSRTQLEGYIPIGKKFYHAYIADNDINDADLTNDGISIEVKQGKWLKLSNEEIGKTAVINGKKFILRILY
ncbi:MAG: hypothetical protein Q8L26_08060 [Candidatus Omnitrophota bacterium]|nr:hypothetical protein [Candidatus Omnitrophota bacterium]